MGVSACFVSHGRSFPHPRLSAAPLKPQQGSRFAPIFVMGSAAADSCARLRVARANRAVTFFAMFRFVFLLPTLFSGCSRVRFGRASRRSHHYTFFYPSKSRSASIIPFHKFHFILSAYRHLPTRKKTSLHGKKPASPAVNGRHPQPLFRFTTLRAICVCHPRSTRRRLAPNAANQKMHYITLSLHFTAFLVLRSRLLYLRCFLLRPHQPPTTHPCNS